MPTSLFIFEPGKRPTEAFGRQEKPYTTYVSIPDKDQPPENNPRIRRILETQGAEIVAKVFQEAPFPSPEMARKLPGRHHNPD